MNLSKLFNFKYLKQNLKKSKGQLVLLLSLVPVFNFLILLLTMNDSYGVTILKEFNIYTINAIGLFTVPIFLSICLFGYVYKRKSVDFINSMPISKKTIFLTNTLCGILLIIAMQLVNMFVVFLASAIHKEVILFSEMLIDSFFVMTIGYIFVFVATNIAMSLSGNKLTQIAVTLLILFLIPFSVDFINNTFVTNEIYYNFIENGNILGKICVENEIENSIPYRIIKVTILGEFENIYSTKSIIKTAFLIIVYVFIGLYIFKNRKFENTEESFSSKYVHFFVKALTMFPMIMLLAFFDYLEQDIELILFIIALLIVYYFVYDLITVKKIRFRDSFINLCITLIMLNVICYGIVKNNENDKLKNINREDIAGVSVNLVDSFREFDDGILDYYMENDEIIDYIYTNKDNYGYYVKLPAKIKLKNGKTYKIELPYSGYDYEPRLKAFISILEKDEKYSKLYKEQFKNYGKFIISDYFVLSDKNEELFNQKLNEYINSTSIEKLYYFTIGNEITKYDYINHTVCETNIPIDINEEIFKIVIDESNRKSKDNLVAQKEKMEKDSAIISHSSYSISSSKKEFMCNIYKEDEIEELEKLILSEETEEINLNNEYYVIKGYDYVNKSRIVFYTKSDKIDELYQKRELEDKISEYDDKIFGNNELETLEENVNIIENTVEIKE